MENKPDECCICSDSLKMGLASLPCGHCFHRHCIDMSLGYKKECPICRVKSKSKDVIKLYLELGEKTSKVNLDIDDNDSEEVKNLKNKAEEYRITMLTYEAENKELKEIVEDLKEDYDDLKLETKIYKDSSDIHNKIIMNKELEISVLNKRCSSLCDQLNFKEQEMKRKEEILFSRELEIKKREESKETSFKKVDDGYKILISDLKKEKLELQNKIKRLENNKGNAYDNLKRNIENLGVENINNYENNIRLESSKSLPINSSLKRKFGEIEKNDEKSKFMLTSSSNFKRDKPSNDSYDDVKIILPKSNTLSQSLGEKSVAKAMINKTGPYKPNNGLNFGRPKMQMFLSNCTKN